MRELAGSIRAMTGQRQRAHSTFLSVLQRACSIPPLFFCDGCRKKQRFSTAAAGFLAASAWCARHSHGGSGRTALFFLFCSGHAAPLFSAGAEKNSDFPRRRWGLPRSKCAWCAKRSRGGDGLPRSKCAWCVRHSRGGGGLPRSKSAWCAQGILAAHAGFPDAFAFIGWRWASVSPRAQQKDACVYKRLFRLTRCFFGKSSTWRMRKMRTVPAICPQARTPRCKAPQARTPPQYSPPCRSMRRRPLA